MAGIVMCPPLDLAGPHREHGLAAIQRLDLALLIHAQYQRTLRRCHIQTNDVADLLHEEGVVRQFEGLCSMRL
ncbi:hypothetical protein KOEU_18000 [Komagataeibacter europaeus]|uniref:Uncharacterized protein n=1 Tax=Komagataeibacter europaeus TaxID=33995 RepID=A0A0M0EDH2_KOMEU|nr:hypothetical protein KOEU_32030 [Komagataeibacter europaeus]KON64830.1 hypothetical protein KOEU_18000 [Komagataeibacter europaeus]